MGHQRDNVLSLEERVKSAKKCIALLLEIPMERQRDWSRNDRNFLRQQVAYSQARMVYRPSEPVLQWLRDMVSKYVA